MAPGVGQRGRPPDGFMHPHVSLERVRITDFKLFGELYDIAIHCIGYIVIIARG